MYLFIGNTLSKNHSLAHGHLFISNVVTNSLAYGHLFISNVVTHSHVHEILYVMGSSFIVLDCKKSVVVCFMMLTLKLLFDYIRHRYAYNLVF